MAGVSTAVETAAALDAAGAVCPGGARALSAAPAAAGPGRFPPSTTWAEAFALRTVAVEDEHVHWTGSVSDHGTPVLRLRNDQMSAYRYAFRLEYGREPEGRLSSTCAYEVCVAGIHLEDRHMRDVGLHRIPVGATWHAGMDLVAVRRALSGVPPRPTLREEEERYAVVVGTGRGLSAEELAQRLGIAPRTVVRWRTEAGIGETGA